MAMAMAIAMKRHLRLHYRRQIYRYAAETVKTAAALLRLVRSQAVQSGETKA